MKRQPLLFPFLLIPFLLQGQELIPFFEQKATNVAQVMSTPDGDRWAAVRGAGFETAGGFYRYRNGSWSVSMAFPYSDSPLLKVFSPRSVYGLHHETHFGHWRYLFYHFDGSHWTRQDIPLKKWDATDYVIIHSMDGRSEADLWLVGQKATVLRRVNGNWVPVRSPVIWKEGEDDFAKDFLSVLTGRNGYVWVGGKNGILIRFNGSEGTSIPLPIRSAVVSLAEDETGLLWIGTDKGEVITWDGTRFNPVPSPAGEKRIQQMISRLNGLFVLSGDQIFQWDPSRLAWSARMNLTEPGVPITSFDLVNPADTTSGFIIGTTTGLFGTTTRGTVSFRDVTSASAISAKARGGFFLQANDDTHPDLYLTGEPGLPDQLLINTGTGPFTDQTYERGLLVSSNGSLAGTAGDIDGDGDQDLLVIRHTDHKVSVFRNRDQIRFDDITGWSGLDAMNVPEPETFWGHSIRLLDADLDGDQDLFVSSWEAGIQWFQNDGVGRFTPGDSTLFQALNQLDNHRLMGWVLLPGTKEGLASLVAVTDNAGTFLFTLSRPGFSLQSVRQHPSLKSISVNILTLPDTGEPVLFLPDRNLVNRIARVSGDSLVVSSIPVRIPSIPAFPGFPGGFCLITDADGDGADDILFGSHLLRWDGSRWVSVKETSGLTLDGNSITGDADSDGDPDLVLCRGSEFGAYPVTFYRNEGKPAAVSRLFLTGLSDPGFQVSIETADSVGKPFRVNGWSGQTALSTVTAMPLVVPVASGRQATVTGPGGNSWSGRLSGPMTTIQVNPAGNGILPEAIVSPLIRTWLYLSLWQELLKLLFIGTGLWFLNQRSNLTGWIGYARQWWAWIPGVVLYWVLFLRTAQHPLAVHLLGPVAGSLLLWTLIATVVYFWVTYLRTSRIGPYRLGRLLGEGSSGKVWEAWSTSDRKPVAIKVFHDRAFDTSEGQIRFQREVAAGTALSHPAIVKIFGQGVHGRQRYLVMELVEGENLRAWLTRDVSPGQVVRWLADLCEAIQVLHDAGMIHRDIKTENIMISPDGHPKIMDLGLAKAAVFATMTRLGTSVGTLAYMSPQQAVGMPLDATADVYSLGVVGYELLTGGTLPVTGDHDMAFVYNIFNQVPVPPSVYNHLVDSDLDSIIMKCLAKQPGDRWASAQEAGNAFGNWLKTSAE
ncbi:MAG: serine/threonine protein kinase [Bacteroidetes bacterium]|nr:serine/threonine protein kinase [Bacteroidota bacterium]